MRSFLAAAVLVLSAGSASALPCSSRSISGDYAVQLNGLAWVFPDQPISYIASCVFHVTRNRRDLANLNISCGNSIPSELGFGKPFQQDCSHGCPWHQLVRDFSGLCDWEKGCPWPQEDSDRCSWTLIDRSDHDFSYRVIFGSDRNELIGQAIGGAGPIEQVGEAIWFHGLKE